MADLRNGARAAIRDTGAGRFLSSVLAAGEMDPMLDGRTDDITLAQALAGVVLHAYAENRVEVPDGNSGGAWQVLRAPLE
jgi:hypothetical protein